jgi:hypothetical protein
VIRGDIAGIKRICAKSNRASAFSRSNMRAFRDAWIAVPLRRKRADYFIDVSSHFSGSGTT